MIYKNGSVYFGEFKNSKKHGILHSYSNLNSTTDFTKKTRKTGKYYADKIDDNWDMVGFLRLSCFFWKVFDSVLYY